MSITRSDVDAIITKRLGALLVEADMTTEVGLNQHLIDPLGWALRALGYGQTSYTDVTDADLSLVAVGHVDALLDLTELRTLESVGGNLTAVDVTIGAISERKSTLGDRVTKLVTDKRKTVQARWGEYLTQPLEGPGVNPGGPVRLYTL